jgi:predicted ATPase/serine phosphatase RsbU (regulator of sigma subunit)
MNAILDYQIIEKINETPKTALYRVRGNSGDTSVIKILKSVNPGNANLARLRREYDSIRNIECQGIVRPLDILTFHGNIAIVFEDFRGMSLKSLIGHSHPDIKTLLRIAIGLADAVGEIHRRNVIHGNIKPSNVLVNNDDLSVKLTDFGIVKIMTRELGEGHDLVPADADLEYLSPEQTGRMNRSVDYRSDLYSLGITLYEMLANAVPFKSSDPMDVIHFHIARKPVQPAARNPAVPRVLSEITMRLLAKNAEDRYQSGFGLRDDLEECLRRLDGRGLIDDFPIGKNDRSMQFILPQKLFGRAQELDALFDAFERVADGATELLLVSGKPGIGKTVLINEMNRPVAMRRGYFLAGKFEQFRPEGPYSAFIHAFQGLVRRLLTEREENLKYWREKLTAFLSPNGRVITDVIPEVELIIGPQPEVAPLGPEESQNRFAIVFKNFVATFTSEGRPLVLFLDDLQWSDAASLALMKNIITTKSIAGVLLIGAYRDTDQDRVAMLNMHIGEIKKDNVPASEIVLGPLDSAAVTEYIAELLHVDRDACGQLSALVLEKTGGNPFFIGQFMKAMHERGHIRIDSQTGWAWDLDGIAQMKITENVIELMIDRIQGLPPSVREVLKVASCAGSRFLIGTVSAVMERTIDDVQADISALVDTGLLYYDGNYCSFIHDRVQEAVYSTMGQPERERYHFLIGYFALESTDRKHLDERIFFIVNNLNAGLDLVKGRNLTGRLVELNLIAGEKAMSSVAYSHALAYFLKGIELLEPGHWDRRYEFSLRIYLLAVEAAYMSLNFQTMDTLSDTIVEHAKSLIDRVRVYEFKIQRLYAENRLVDAVSEALEALRLLGISISREPSTLNILWNLIRTKIALFGVSPEKLTNLAKMDNPRIEAANRILSNLSHSAYRSYPRMVPVLIFTSIRNMIAYGYTPQLPYTLAGYSMFLCGAIGDIDGGYPYSELAWAMKDRHESRKESARTSILVELTARHWKVPLRDILQPVQEIYQVGLEVGDIEFATIAAHNYCAHSFYAGKPLKDLIPETKKYSLIIAQYKQETNFNYNELLRQVMLNLVNDSDDPSLLEGEAYRESEMVPRHVQANEGTALFSIHYYKAIINYLFGNYREARKHSLLAGQYLGNVLGLILVPLYYFYDALIHSALLGDLSLARELLIRRRIRRDRNRLKKHASHSPENHLHRVLLVEAESARARKSFIRAEELYGRAIDAARESQYLHDFALSQELTGRFYIRRGLRDIGRMFLARARGTYAQWGADAKVKRLDAILGLDAEPDGAGAPRAREGAETAAMPRTESLDLASILQASQSLASEIELRKLLATIMKIITENAGAQRGVLLMAQEGSDALLVEAEYMFDGTITVLQGTPLDVNTSIPLSVINYVNKTGKNLVLDNAFLQGLFMNDPYIIRNRAQSIVCSPIMDKGSRVGIIYLENNITAGAFTTGRLELLKILSSQAAISINNVRYIENEKTNAVLRKEMETSQNIIQQLLPQKLPAPKNARVHYLYVPMIGIGGDFVNIQHDEANNRLGVFICDVSGHGIPSALTASMISMALDINWKGRLANPAQIIENTRRQLLGKLGSSFFTACICSLDLGSGAITFASAGHPPPVIIRADGSTTIVQTRGRLINEYFRSDCVEVTEKLGPGDRVFLYTDGITEAENPDKIMLGGNDAQFSKWLGKISSESATLQDLCQSAFEEAIKYTVSTVLEDDFTIAAIEYVP